MFVEPKTVARKQMFAGEILRATECVDMQHRFSTAAVGSW